MVEAKQVDECLELKLETANGLIPLYVTVDFVSKKLLFTPEKHAKMILSSGRYNDRFVPLQDLVYRYLENGRLELWDEETEAMLGQSRGYQPTSALLTKEGLIDAGRDAHHFDLATQIRMQMAAASSQT